jgi:hypothetical protein
MRVDVYQATLNVGMILQYLSDQAEDVNSYPLEFEADRDESRTSGDQLLKIYDAQAVA